VCGVDCDNKGNFKVHRQSAKHKRKAALGLAKQQASAVSGKDKGDSGAYCDICKVQCNSKAQLQVHQASQKHLAKSVRALEQRQGNVLEKGGVLLEGIGTGSIQVAPGVLRVLELTLRNTGGVVRIFKGCAVAAGTPSVRRAIDIVDSITPAAGDGLLSIHPGSAHTISVNITVDRPGVEKTILCFNCDAFSIGAVLKLECSQGGFDSLRASEPFRPPPRHRKRVPTNVVPGEKPPGRRAKLPIPPPRLIKDPLLWRMMEAGDKAGVRRRIGAELPSTVDEVVRRHGLLLQAKYYQHEVDILQYAMEVREGWDW
jgi:hypothetical protein